MRRWRSAAGRSPDAAGRGAGCVVRPALVAGPMRGRTRSPGPPPAGQRRCMIYTSGTTGLPKAAHVSHARVLEWSVWFAGMMDAQPEDRLYDCLPLYHSTGGVVAVGAMLVRGGSVRDPGAVLRQPVLGRRRARRCTVFQYIGELCRYLLKTPPHPRERPHRLRLLRQRPERRGLARFQERFADPAHPGILRRHRGQRFALQLRGQARRDRPHAALPCAPFPAGADALRPEQRASRCGTPPGDASRAQLASPARRWHCWPTRPVPPHGASRATPTRQRPSARCCATCSPRVTAGSAPAT